MQNKFRQCTTLEELKREYKRMALAHHPDLHPDDPNATRTMQEINQDYTAAAAVMIKRQEQARAHEAHANGRKVKSDFIDLDEVVKDMQKIILDILKVSKDLEIEITGLWLWVSGDTKTHKKELKELGLKWASKKKLWYFAGIPSSGRGKSTMQDIRATYGSARIKKEEKAKPSQAIA